ncbi:hypothetical protein [Streptomyces fumanus]|uniref:hypothetical protein n=1 Tax=Streptomyces fumanus TaxID=67302 RepID=UPI0033E9B055
MSEADDLVAALEAGTVAGAQCQVVELDGMAPASRGVLFVDGWDEGVRTVSEALVGIADVRQRERADLVRLERFVREAVLPGTRPHTTARRWVLEALGEAGGLCTARTRNADGDVMVCTLDAGHYDPDDKPPFKDGKPGGWHKADASIWNDLGAACIPHAAI